MDEKVIVHRDHERFVTSLDGIRTCHIFSSGAHYDPQRLSRGRIVGVDEHLVAGGDGFESHPHVGVEIYTYVLEGALRHVDGTYGERIVEADHVQRQLCGTGITHTELNASATEQLCFVQLLLLPHGARSTATNHSYTMAPDFFDTDPVRLHRLGEGESVQVESSQNGLIYVARGDLWVSSVEDTVRRGDWLDAAGEVVEFTAESEAVLLAVDG